MTDKSLAETVRDAIKFLRTRGYPRPAECDVMADRLQRALAAHEEPKVYCLVCRTNNPDGRG